MDQNLNVSHLVDDVGLFLTRMLVGMHSGTITVANNTDGPGVNFTILLPLAEDQTDVLELNNDEIEADEEEATMMEVEDGQVDNEYKLDSKRLKSQATIVIVESNKNIRDYLHEQLQARYNIICFGNAEDAMAYILVNRPDLIITEVFLPGEDGISMIKKIRQNITINDVPIIVLSGQTEDVDVMRCMESGADCYLSKPFSFKVLKSHISALLAQRHRLKVIYNGKQVDQEIRTDDVDLKTPDQQLMQRLSKAINENIANPDYTIEDMASDVCMSRVHLNRKLKQLTNQSPSTYLRNMRLAKAAELLRENPGIAVSEVAVAVGIPSFSHFSHSFKQLYGCTPSEYR